MAKRKPSTIGIHTFKDKDGEVRFYRRTAHLLCYDRKTEKMVIPTKEELEKDKHRYVSLAYFNGLTEVKTDIMSRWLEARLEELANN